MKETIVAVEKAFVEIGAGTVISPPRPNIYVQRYNGTLILNCGYLEKSDSMAVKIASSYPGNIEAGLPTVDALMVLYDAHTGETISILEGSYLTAMKTGASGAVAAKYLARENSKTVGIIGTGVQAETQLWGLVETVSVESVIAYDLHEARKKEFCNKIKNRFQIEAKPAGSVSDVVRAADILVTATTSKAPVFDGSLLKEGTHLTGIGSFTHDTREIDDAAIRKAKRVFVDDEEALAVGDIRIPLETGIITPESVVHLAHAITGKSLGRQAERDITIFKSVGGAAYDTSVAATTYQLAKQRGIGQEFVL